MRFPFDFVGVKRTITFIPHEIGNVSRKHNFINLVFDDAAVFAELNSDVKIDGEALFFDALNQIVDMTERKFS